MKTFQELYQDILEQEIGKGRKITGDYNPVHMDCLLHPEQYAPVIAAESCVSCEDERACMNSCVFDAIEEKNGEIHINAEKCTGCGECIDVCKLERITANKDVLPVIQAVRSGKKDVYVLIAPAFTGQFGENATPGRLRTAFKAIGFKGMVEVAVFADILTLKEALEFEQHVQKKEDFQLTSCCCPVWIAMIRKIYSELVPHVPGAVSPMIAAGRVVKELYPDAMTVFVGPCMAKKKEAREEDIADAIDYVLTFQEVQDVFHAAGIQPELLSEDEKEHSSKAGRIYARTGGVSEAVKKTVEQIDPDKKIPVIPEQADGVPACKKLIERIQKGETEANFFEGMACNGGCVGGPKIIIIKEEGKELVAIRDNDYNKVEQYLKSGWDPNENTKSVYYSIKYNTESNKKKDEWKILELLLKHGANPDVQIFQNPTGVNTPLTYTTECGYYGATKLLLEYGADCNFQEDYMKQNGLLALRFYENDAAAKTLQLLLDYGTDLDIKQSDNKSGREELKNFQKDYMNVKDKVPNYDEIVEIIDRLKI